MKHYLSLLIAIFCVAALSLPASAQINARLFQQPDVSATTISFVYAGDVWTVPKSGGIATRLTSPQGQESFPKFSPDGKMLAFSANYSGNTDVYVIPVGGGIPQQLTYHSYGDRVVDWNPDGKRVLFTSSRESGRQRYSQFYLIDSHGGMAEKLPVPYGEFGTFSPDGKQFAYTDKSRVFRTWKRYRGGMAPDITLFNLDNLSSEVLIESDANEEIPMWSDKGIFYLSDKGTNKKANLWMYNLQTKENIQLTHFVDYDIHFPSLGPEDIVFEAGGKLYLMNLATKKYADIQIQIISDQIALQPRLENPADHLAYAWIAPNGNRVVVEARGDLFSVPAEHGYIKNLTQTSGVAERYPSWSPNGKFIAYWSDESGEYELHLLDMEHGTKKILTHYGPGFRYQTYWSPDSKKLAFVDQSMRIKMYELDNQRTVDVDKGLHLFHLNLQNFSVSWSSDSKWLAYARDLENRHAAVFLFDTNNHQKHQVTSGYYSTQQPSFDPEGKYLYVVTNRHFSPDYSDMDNSFIYSNSTQLAAISLRNDVASPLEPQNDTVAIKKDKEESVEKAASSKKKGKKKNKEQADEEEPAEVIIDLDGFESRMTILPPKAGNYTRLTAIKGKLIYQQFPNTGTTGQKNSIQYFDLKERASKTIIKDVDGGYMISADENKMLVLKGNSMSVVDVKQNQKMDKKLPLQDMQMEVNPKEEWKQIFRDAWRLERDYFYDKNMHGVDWQAKYDQYAPLVDDAASRNDVNFLLGELIGELSSSHTYKGGGDTDNGKRVNVGYLGVDFEINQGAYRIKKILRAAPWDIENKSPLDMPGVEAREGDYILAVNGVPLTTAKEPYAAFAGLGGKTVELSLNSQPIAEGARKVIVKTLTDESRIRHLAWIEHNRLMVDEATKGKVGYIYVRSTGRDGQNELVRQFMGQWDKKGLIIDERFNSGGQIPDRFIELLNRKPLAYWAVRDGKDWQWPPVANFGPKVMLINGWSGSGGDAFPDYFRKAGLGPLVGTRTWGGLIGISGAPALIDGGAVTIPTFRMYDPDGKWFLEGHGVDPDIKVREDASALAKGGDAQLQKAIEVILQNIEKNGYEKPNHPPVEKR